MCGIAGILNLSGPDHITIDKLRKMAGCMSHRGPDQSGIYIDNNIAIAQTRLSIIDLPGGSQPIHNEDKTLWIIFNGEIYNYIELKSQLTKKGHIFYTGSDTEVIIHLYEDEKENSIQHLNGQFAFAVWDFKRKELFIARDRVGKKPLFYTSHNNLFYFASEIKSIFACPEIEREMHPHSLDQIFTFWTTLPGNTFFKNIHEIPAGSYLKISTKDFKVRQYWDFDFALEDQLLKDNAAEIAVQAEKILLDSVNIRLRADVPVGSYLSGGLDSSGITSLIKNNFNNKLETFGIRFEDPAFDEGNSQDEMVKTLNTVHHTILAADKIIGQKLSDVLWHCETPLLRLSPVPLFILSKIVNELGFKVVLTGEGADEIFGGYNIFRETLVRAFWAKYPDSNLRPLLLERLYPYIFKDNKSKAGLKSFFKPGLDNLHDPFFSHLIRWQNTSKLKRFLSDDIKQETGKYDPFLELLELLPEKFNQWDPLSKAQYLESKIFMSNYLLSSQGDRVAMAHSVEIRMPYLDYRLIELMGKVPSYLKIRGLNEKFILKKIYKDILPGSIIKKPKHPYRAPIRDSLLNNNLDYVEYYLSKGILKNFNLFNPGMVLKLKEKLCSQMNPGEFDSMALAGILTTQIINDKFIGNFDLSYCKPVEFDLVYDCRTE
jgi:asparagine synthase (glutamine-hydrolysing)